MKYDGSAGTRAPYSSTRLRYVRWVAMILVGSTGARKVASAAETSPPPSRSTRSPRRAPHRGDPVTSTRTRGSATIGYSIPWPGEGQGGTAMTDQAERHQGGK